MAVTVYVIGLDGADWGLLRPLIDEGHLPAFRKIVDEGADGNLQSTHPPLTCPAWQAYATGKNPGKLGVYGWMHLDRETKTVGFNEGGSFRARTYFELLCDAGLTVGVVNLPTTYPADRYDDIYLVAGPSGIADKRSTNPPGLRDELAAVVPDYRVEPETEFAEVPRDNLLDKVRELFDQRFAVADWLHVEKDCDVLHITLFGTDTLQHYYWDEPDVVRETYEHVDGYLGRLLKRDDTDAIFLMSDHGFGPLRASFAPNQWLADRGDLTVKVNPAVRTMGRTGLTRQRLKDALLRVGLLDPARGIVPADWRRRFLPNDDGSTSIVDADVDWSATRAVSLGHGPMYLNEDAFESQDDEEAYLKEMLSAMTALVSPDGGPVVKEIHDADDIYSGHGNDAPEVVVEYAPGVDASSVSVGGEIFDGARKWSACHRQSGIFAAFGTSLRAMSAELDIVDLAPTLLHYLGESIPRDMDGNVRRELFTGSTANRDVVTRPATDDREATAVDDETVATRLEDLGYLD